MGGKVRNHIWSVRFGELKRYKARHGDCNVRRKQGKLGTWVMTQRTEYRADKLARDRIDRLDSIGFDWAPKKSEVERLRYEVGGRAKGLWDVRFRELKQYRARHGDCNVNTQKQGKLGSWVKTQRAAYKADKLARDRIDRLNSIGFDWAPRKPIAEGLWNAHFGELERYRAKHGDCNVSMRSGGTLGNWVSSLVLYAR